MKPLFCGQSSGRTNPGFANMPRGPQGEHTTLQTTRERLTAFGTAKEPAARLPGRILFVCTASTPQASTAPAPPKPVPPRPALAGASSPTKRLSLCPLAPLARLACWPI